MPQVTEQDELPNVHLGGTTGLNGNLYANVTFVFAKYPFIWFSTCLDGISFVKGALSSIATGDRQHGPRTNIVTNSRELYLESLLYSS